MKKKDISKIVMILLSLLFVSICSVGSIQTRIDALPWVESTPIEGMIAPPMEVTPEASSDQPNIKLHALSACLMDASNGRVLYGKDAYKELPMASTTKIMTLLIVLEQGNLEDTVTVSKNAAKQPNVQLNICTGDQYKLGDLVYSLMLESHNDVAVAIAEHVGGSVEEFCNLMTAKAKELGAEHTSFKTPNGLDAEGHYTTARDLSLIASYAIKNKEFCKIVKTQTYQFNELLKGRSYCVDNKDRFLYMMKGAIGIKTGFTGLAGHCFVGAIDYDGKQLVSTVLGSGWPPHRTYKWNDTTNLMKYGLDKFALDTLSEKLTVAIEIPKDLIVRNGTTRKVVLQTDTTLLQEKMLFREGETVTMQMELLPFVTAPVEELTEVGMIDYYIGDTLYQSEAIHTVEEVKEIDFFFVFQELLKIW